MQDREAQKRPSGKAAWDRFEFWEIATPVLLALAIVATTMLAGDRPVEPAAQQRSGSTAPTTPDASR